MLHIYKNYNSDSEAKDEDKLVNVRFIDTSHEVEQKM